MPPHGVLRLTQLCEGITAATLTINYPKINSMIFSTYACDVFDDGSRRLLASDFAVDCDSELHRATGD